MSSTLKQACIILVAGTILVSLLSVAIPPAPASVNTRMAAPQPQLSQPLRAAQGRKRGGVRSQSQVRTTNKKLEERPSQSRHHWNADTLEHGGALADIIVSSEEDSPSQQQLAAEIESKTKKENTAANGVFGRTNTGDENNEEKENVVDTPKAAKGHVDIDALDSNDKASHNDEAKTDKKTNAIQVKDEGIKSDEKDKDGGKTRDDKQDHLKNEAEIEKSPVKIVEKELNDQPVVKDASESDGVEEKQGAFGKDAVENNAKRTVVNVEKSAPVDDKRAANNEGTKSSADNRKDTHISINGEDKEAEGVNLGRSSKTAQDDGKADLAVEVGDNKLESSKHDGVAKAEKPVELNARGSSMKKDDPEAREFSPNQKTVNLDTVVTERKRIAREEVAGAPSDTARQGRP